MSSTPPSTARVYLETFGCQMNKLDSELVAGELVRQGFLLTPRAEDADVVLFNTCSVRQHAEDKVYSRLGRLRLRKQYQPDLIVGVIGCMAENVREELFRRAPHLDLICGPGELHRVPSLIEQAATQHTAAVALAPRKRGGKPFGNPNDDPLERLDLGRFAAGGSVREDPWRAYLRVQRGCNHMCAFCIVPYTRGKEVYRPPDNIVQEAEGLVDDGVREITLLGQNINSYRWDLPDGRTVGLGYLLRRLNRVAGLRRIRFVTSHPADMDNDILAAVGDCENVAPYLHMPAQSGSDAVLARMRRGYTRGFYLDRVEAARRRIPLVEIVSDFIVGFPGETDADFQQSLSLVSEVGFKNSFVFKYSPRPGTPAAKLADDVPDSVKRERNRQLLAAQESVSAARNSQNFPVGQVVEVLCEGPSKMAESLATADSVILLAGPAASSPGLAVNPPRPACSAERKPALPLKLYHSVDDASAEPAAPGPAASPRQLAGRTATDHVVVFDGPADLCGQFVSVRIVRTTAYTLFGEWLGSADAVG